MFVLKLLNKIRIVFMISFLYLKIHSHKKITFLLKFRYKSTMISPIFNCVTFSSQLKVPFFLFPPMWMKYSGNKPAKHCLIVPLNKRKPFAYNNHSKYFNLIFQVCHVRYCTCFYSQIFVFLYPTSNNMRATLILPHRL